MTIVICGAAGIGKTWLSQEETKRTALDLVPTEFKWGKPSATCLNNLAQQAIWPQNYCDHIEIEIRAGTYDVVLAASYPEVVAELLQRGIEVCLVYPDLSQKEEYRQRYIARGNPPAIVKLLTDHFDEWIANAQSQRGCKKIVLMPGQFLSGVMSIIMGE